MRRRLAVMICAALMTAMLGACGGSTGASSSEAQAPAETATEEAAPEADAAAQEAAPEADAAKEEAAPAADAAAQEAAPEADAAAQADGTVAEAGAGTGTGAFASGTLFAGAITPSEKTEDSDVEKLDGVDAQGALGSAPAIETIEGLNGEEPASLNGKISLQGKTQEYSAYFLGKNNGVMGFAVVFESAGDTLTNYAEIYDFEKSAGYTKDDMLAFDITKAYPGINSMSCTDWTIVDAGSVFRLMVVFAQLDNPDHVKECMDNGVFTSPNYQYPQLLSASALKSSFTSDGCYQLTDEEIDKLHLVK